MRNKRRFKRVDANLPVTLRCDGRLIPATTLNISCGGVCLHINEAEFAWLDSSDVELIIDLSQGQRDISLRGEVTRVDKDGKPTVGVKFTNLYTIGHQTLERFINKHLN
jgi:c-di-GMP-binding flagellar brake protein YcgR